MLNSANVYKVKFGSEGVFKIARHLKFDLSAGINLESGNTNSLYDNNQFEPNNELKLKKAEFIFRPISFVKLKAGAIGLKDSNHSLLLPC